MIESVHSPYIHEGNTDNFRSLVLENSDAGPVLVNFWSRKAGPCLRQYPILDKLIHHYAGRLLLVNVDTEQEFVFTKQYGIASVPTLKLFRFAKVVETLHGYKSEEDLKKVLEMYVVRASDKILADAIRRYGEGKSSEAYEMIAEAIVEDPVNPRLPAAMCKLLKHEERYQEAVQLIDAVPDEVGKNHEITQLRALLSFHVDAIGIDDIKALTARGEACPDDLPALKQLVAYCVVHQHYQDALQQLANMMELDQEFDDQYPRQAMLKVFTLLGQDHPLVAQYKHALRRYVH